MSAPEPPIGREQLARERNLALAFVGFLAWPWPAVPWTTIQVVVPVGLGAMPALMFPVSKLAWPGFDLALRPPPEG